MSAAALIGLVSYEGYTSRAVIPIHGDKPTIGFGTTAGVKLGDKITPEVALARVLADVQKLEGAIKRCVKAPLLQREYDAYTQFSYNVGISAFCSSTLVKKLNARDYVGACAELSRWNKAGGRVVKGLTVRRAKERALCEGK